ncbi:MAG TPA: hypothetical protein VMV10_30170 [Pirellulales bacterium]|nr:hypothetical protein [Pirellulales bacterium]
MNPEQYLQLVATQICENFAPNDPTGSMTAAKVGYLVRRTVPEPSSAFGFLKFKDALIELERRGLVRLGPNSKGALAVWRLAGEAAEAVAGGPPVAPFAPVSLRPSRFLRPPVWSAFVSQFPEGERLFNKVSGELRLGRAGDAEPNDDWAKIDSLDIDAQREDSRAFLLEEGRQDDPSLLAAIESPRWYSDLPAALRAIDRALEGKWKRHRSRWVIAHVEKWCGENGISHALVFQQAAPSRHALSSPPGIRSGGDLKEHLLAALRRMSTGQLLALRIPAKHLVEVLRPDLLAE